jgi:hypothetical protein
MSVSSSRSPETSSSRWLCKKYLLQHPRPGLILVFPVIIRNVQKYAHARLERDAESPRAVSPVDDDLPQNGVISLDDSDIQQAHFIPRVEVEPPTPSTDTGMFSNSQKKHTVLVPATRVSSGPSHTTQTIREEEEDETEKGREKQTYLRSKLWWLGLLLMAVGESANFISYGLAAASVVAPLGTVGKSSLSFSSNPYPEGSIVTNVSRM